MKDAWLIIGLIALIFLIWLLTGGPTHPISFTGPTIRPPQQLGGGTYLSFPKAPFGIGDTVVALPGSSSGQGPTSVTGTGNVQASFPSLNGVSFGNPSAYRSVVSMSHYVSGAGSTDPANESVTISVPVNAGVPVDITGWTIESAATGNAAVIPQGTKVPLTGTITPAQDIVLLPGDTAILISGRSPLGASFEENKCTGYYSQFQSFSPNLPQDCPDPSSELQRFYGSDYIRDDTCINYVKTIPRCEAVLSPPVTLSGACQSFMVKYLNYDGCVDAHKNDSDFESNTWYVYLGSTSSLWRTRNEVIKLVDAKGNTVDAFTY